MRKYLILAALVIAVAACRQGGAKAPAEIIADEGIDADFGLIPEQDGPRQIMLLIPNNSADTLYPVDFYTRCLCTEVHLDRRAVAPGAMQKVQVIYNPAYRGGVFMEEIQLFYAGGMMKSIVFKGEVIPCEHPVEENYPYDYGDGLHMTHSALHFGLLKAGERGDIFLRYTTEQKSTLTFEAIGPYAANLSFRNPDSGHESDSLHFRFTMPEGLAPSDTLIFKVQPYLDGKPTKEQLTIKAIGR